MLLTLVIVVVVLALVFDYINGMHDTANSIATVVSTRVLSPRNAILMAASLNFIGALWSEAVAKTIGKGIVDPSVINQTTVMAALVAAILWNLITWYFGIPSSSSHALIGGVIGAAIASVGTGKLHVDGIVKVVKGLVFSPIIGGGIAFLIMLGILWGFRNVPPGRSNRWFKGLQMASASIMAFSHGMGDAQKSMGIIVMALVAGQYMDPANIHVPLWVKFSCAAAMALGTASGGWRIIKTLGHKMIKLQPVHGFAAEAAASTVILTASSWGVPVSTTHSISGAIMGVGMTRRLNSVRWDIAGQMVFAWVLTIPATAAIAYGTEKLLMMVF
ncbi:MAG TPA: inorganic phosphate transporter [Fibrobacteria bacterium]|nr:inorganic phosphate transporter [Fibrobacteria bacterium]HOX52354.1 inorganic phosphate transporter [Fibrobacteria bacterium]